MKRNSDDSPRTSKSTSDSVREYKVWELEKKAESILAAVFPSGLSVPIEIEDVAFRLGLEINPIPGLQAARQVLGALWRDSHGKYWIVVDEHMMDYRETRYRFTVAEETSHFVLHREYLDEAKDIAGAVNLQQRLSGSYSHIEANTRRLAAGLLMPKAPLSEDAASAYRAVIRVVGYRNLEAVRVQVTDILRRKYAVSSEAMRYRLLSHPLRAHEAIGKAFLAHSDTLWESL
jgi:hypothetical protein